jgi:hypothetical protein
VLFIESTEIVYKFLFIVQVDSVPEIYWMVLVNFCSDLIKDFRRKLEISSTPDLTNSVQVPERLD